MTTLPARTGPILRAAADLVLGVQCHGCGTPGFWLCPSCRELLSTVPRRVWRHQRGLAPTYSVLAYAGVGRGLVVGLKERGAWMLLRPLASAVARCCALVVLQRCAGAVTLVPAPSSRASVRQRGLDTTWELARRAARELQSAGLQADARRWLAKRSGVRDQAGLSAHERAQNMAGRVRRRGSPRGSVIIVDDVVTTGATLIECARVLRGQAQVLGCATVAARGWS